MLKPNRETGSVVPFVVIAIILAALTIGGIYIVQHRGEQVRQDQAAKIADQIAQQAADDAAKTAPAVDNSSDVASTPDTTPPQTDTALPATGVEFDILRTLGIGLLVGIVISYIVSRRSLQRPL